MGLKEDNLKRLKVLGEEKGMIDYTIKYNEDDFELLEAEIEPVKEESRKLRDQYTCLSLINRVIEEDIRSLSKQECKEEEIEYRRKRSKILEDIITDLIEKQETVNEELGDKEREMASCLGTISIEEEKRKKLQEEVKPILLSLDKDDVNEIPEDFIGMFKRLVPERDNKLLYLVVKPPI